MRTLMCIILTLCCLAIYVTSAQFITDPVAELDIFAFLEELERTWPSYDPIQNFLEYHNLPQGEKTFLEFLKHLGTTIFDSAAFPVVAAGVVVNALVSLFLSLDKLIVLESEVNVLYADGVDYLYNSCCCSV